MARYNLSLSVTQGDVSEYHSRRTYTPPSAEPSLASRNVHLVDPRHDDGSLVTYREQFNEEFAPSIGRYNARQKRKKLKKDGDYYAEIDGSKRKEKPVYSTVLQIGNRDDCGVTDMSFDAKHWRALKATDPDAAAAYVAEHLDPRPQQVAAKETLIDICERFEEWYPNLKVVSCVVHDDEPDGTCHVDINWIPVAGGEGSGVYKGGLDTRCALNKALAQMGYDGKGYDYAIKHWQADFKTRCAEVMLEHDIERRFMDNKEKHKDVATWRLEQEREDIIMQLQELRRKAENTRQNTEEMERRIAELEEREAELTQAIKKKERALGNANDDLEDAEYRLKRAEQRAERAEKRADDAEKRLDEASDESAEYKRRLDEIRDTYRREKREADELEETMRQHKRDAERYEEEARKAKKVVENCKEEVDRAKKQRDAWYRELERVAELVDRFKKILMAFVTWVNDRRSRGEIDMSPRSWVAMRHVVEDYGDAFQAECEDMFTVERANAKREPEDVKKPDLRPLGAHGRNIPASQNKSIDLSPL